ncbi:trypsin-like peptidase domain-containing protein [Streptomyces marispadix]|uniref:Serine protease n=1 Tax=Streptomyces marispadix TaxID=2922868 RepID=A0ABS9SZ58_9ACTN|nr:trypsin-like peptidase domain-containing protein [Streptomyces marispadix]MCH6161579.1 serine protease [Streptomyces marispadix]
MPISPFSVASLLLTPLVETKPLGTATGFVLTHDAKNYLITNWHVVAGRNRLTGQPIHNSAATPDSITIRCLENRGRRASYVDVARWVDVSEELLDEEGMPLWLEHPKFGRRVDVVALPLTPRSNTQLVPYNDQLMNETMRAGVSDWVNILGFPFGVTGGGSLAVWTKGAIATEVDVDFGDLPCFLIDSRTRPGQSGSPVIAYSPGGMTAMANGETVMAQNAMANLLGVYSGRINEKSDLGHVWKTKAVREILTNGVEGNGALNSNAT